MSIEAKIPADVTDQDPITTTFSMMMNKSTASNLLAGLKVIDDPKARLYIALMAAQSCVSVAGAALDVLNGLKKPRDRPDVSSREAVLTWLIKNLNQMETPDHA